MQQDCTLKGQKVKSMKSKVVGCRGVSNLAALAATLLLAGCGGGDDTKSLPSTSSSNTTPTVSAGAPESKAAALRLYEAAAVLASLSASPLIHALSNNKVWTDGACIFGEGSLQAALDGMAPAKGTVLPSGTHTFAVTFANCLVDGLVGIRLSGSASTAYKSNDPDLKELTAMISASSIRGTGSLGFRSNLSDVTANGLGTWTRVQRSDEVTTTYTPTTGATLINNLTTNIATFTAGSYSSSSGPPPQGSAALERSDFNNLAVAINGVSYVLNGTLQSVYGFDSRGIHAGEVQITSNGALRARIYGDENGAFLVEIVGLLILL